MTLGNLPLPPPHVYTVAYHGRSSCLRNSLAHESLAGLMALRSGLQPDGEMK
jgi:hypothetical protein